MARKVTIPGQNVPFLLPSGMINPDWYIVLKFLETLQPLSDIPAPSLPAPLTPGNTTVSVTAHALTTNITSPSPVVQTQLVFSGVSFPNQTQSNDWATVADVNNKADANESALATAVGSLNTRVIAAENKINDLITALS